MIRTAKEKDLPEILEIFNHAIEFTTAMYDYKTHTLDQRKIWYMDRRDRNLPVIVYEKDGQVVGFASYGSFRPQEAYKYTVEHSVYIHSDYQGIGIGGLLLNEIINLADKQEFASIIGVIDASNERSIILHNKFGFQQVGYLKKAGYKFGTWLDVVLLQKFLTGPQTPKEL